MVKSLIPDCFEQLIYLEDVEPMKIQFLRETVSQREIQDFFEKQIKKIKI